MPSEVSAWEKRNQLLFLLAGAFLLALGGLIWMGWNAYRHYDYVNLPLKRDFRIERLRGVIANLDEVLTMSARMAAATGDLSWEVRYRQFEPKLDAAIREAERLLPEGENGAAARTNAANIRLVAMENEAFDLVRQGRREEAQALLASDAYQVQKEIYSSGIGEMSTHLEQSTAAALEEAHRAAFFHMAAVCIVVPILAGGFIWIFRVIRRWQDAFLAGHAQLAGANRELEREVAARKSSESTLLLQKARFEQLFENSPIGIVMLDTDDRIVAANRGFEWIFQYRPAEVLGQAINDVIVPPHLFDEATRLSRATLVGTSIHVESIRQRKDGSMVNVYIYGYPIVIEGRPAGTYGMYVDITAHKQAQEATVNALHALARTQSELEEANTRLERLALTDPLTGLFNRWGFEHALAKEIHKVRQGHAESLVLLMDLDDFKQINDVFGHAVGDVVLKDSARKLMGVLRTTDLAARIGGDEFLVLLPDTKSQEGVHITERIRMTISDKTISLPSGPVTVTTSIGVMRLMPDTSSIDELLSRIHHMLYGSKRRGKNRVTYAWHQREAIQETDVLGGVLERLQIESYFTSVSQPIFRLSDRANVAGEFLGRSSIEGFEKPGDFFRVSMEGKILTLVDMQCFRTCLKAALETHNGRRKHLNLFPSTLIDVTPPQLLANLPADLPAGRICIELSEQQIIGDPLYLSERVKLLKKAGLLLAIDDVGFGQSCLESIVVLEPDLVKIDRVCVKGIARDDALRRRLHRLLGMMKGIGVEIVAEGIEETDDLEVLKALGVEFGQGYLLGLPA